MKDIRTSAARNGALQGRVEEVRVLRQSTVHPCLFEQGRGVMRGTRPLQGRISLHSRAHTRLRAARRSFAAALAAASCSADSSRGARCAACQPASNANSFGSVRLFMDPSATRALRSVGSTLVEIVVQSSTETGRRRAEKDRGRHCAAQEQSCGLHPIEKDRVTCRSRRLRQGV